MNLEEMERQHREYIEDRRQQYFRNEALFGNGYVQPTSATEVMETANADNAYRREMRNQFYGESIAEGLSPLTTQERLERDRERLYNELRPMTGATPNADGALTASALIELQRAIAQPWVDASEWGVSMTDQRNDNANPSSFSSLSFSDLQDLLMTDPRVERVNRGVVEYMDENEEFETIEIKSIRVNYHDLLECQEALAVRISQYIHGAKHIFVRKMPLVTSEISAWSGKTTYKGFARIGVKQ